MAISVDLKISVCSTCKVRIVFMPTPAGKQMPVNADTVCFGDTQFNPKVHKAHWVTCDQPDAHRKPKPVNPYPAPTFFTVECDAFEERAAIMEFDGRMSRADAERMAAL